MKPHRDAGQTERCAACDKDLPETAAFAACRGCLARHHTSCWPKGARCARCAGAEAFRAGAPEHDDPNALPVPPAGSIIAVSRRRGLIEFRWSEPAEEGRWLPGFFALSFLASLFTLVRLRDGWSNSDAGAMAIAWLIALVGAFVYALMQPRHEPVRLRVGPRGLSFGRGRWGLRGRRSLAWSEIKDVVIEEAPEGARLVLRGRGRVVPLAGARGGAALTPKDRLWLLTELRRRVGRS